MGKTVGMANSGTPGDTGQNRNKTGGKSTGAAGSGGQLGGGAGTAALTSPAAASAPSVAPDGMTLQGRIFDAFDKAGKDYEHGVRGTPSPDQTYDNTGRLQTDGTSPYVSDPSAGQIAGAVLGAAPVAGTLNRAAGLAAGLANGDNPVSGDDGGMIGRLLDGMRGVKPGAVTGYTGNRVASSTNSRGDQGDDTRMADRAGAAATAALTGDAPAGGAGTDALFSDVALADRRKPRSDLAGTSMLLKAA